jgi:hypothetical protein
MAGATVCGWVRIDDGVSITYDVCGEVVEFEIGNRPGEFQILTTEGGLTNLIEHGTAALQRLRARADAIDE